MRRDGRVRQAGVDEADRGSVAVAGQGDGHGAAARGYLGVVLEAPGENDAMRWLDLKISARDRGGLGHDAVVGAAASRVERRAQADPPVVHLGIGEEAEHDLRWRLDVDLLLDAIAGDRHAPRPEAHCGWPGDSISDSASALSRARPAAQRRSMNCLSPSSPAGFARYIRLVPSRRSATRPADLSTVRCWEMAGRVTSKNAAIWPADSS